MQLASSQTLTQLWNPLMIDMFKIHHRTFQTATDYFPYVLEQGQTGSFPYCFLMMPASSLSYGQATYSVQKMSGSRWHQMEKGVKTTKPIRMSLGKTDSTID